MLTQHTRPVALTVCLGRNPRFRRRERDGMCHFLKAKRVARFAVVLVRPMIARLGIASGSLCLAWIMAGSVLAGAQPWQPRDPEPPPGLPAATGLTHTDEAAMRLLIEAQIAAMRAKDFDGVVVPGGVGKSCECSGTSDSGRVEGCLLLHRRRGGETADSLVAG